jgi:hypothetical protein
LFWLDNIGLTLFAKYTDVCCCNSISKLPVC